MGDTGLEPVTSCVSSNHITMPLFDLSTVFRMVCFRLLAIASVDITSHRKRLKGVVGTKKGTKRVQWPRGRWFFRAELFTSLKLSLRLEHNPLALIASQVR
jgi:hypothetical protein